MHFSLRARFLAPTIAAVVIGTCILTAVSYYKSSSVIAKTTEGQLTLLLESTTKGIDSSVDDFKLLLKDWKDDKLLQTAAQSSVEDQNTKAASSRLASLQGIFTVFERINLANKQGLVIASSDPQTIGKINLSDRNYFKDALSGKLNVSDVVLSKTTGKPVVMVSAPLKDGETAVGVLSGVLDMEHFGKIYIEPVKVGEKGYAYMFGQDGLMLSNPDHALNYKLNMKETDFGRQMLAGKRGMLTHTDKGVERIVAYGSPKELNVIIGVTADVAELLAPIRAIRWINLALSASIVLIVGIITFLVASSVSNPIGRTVANLMEAAEQVASGSTQISTVSQQLSEAAAEQAASLEETSSSLEEMSSMTKRNADNAREANRLMSAGKAVVDQANQSMVELTSSMADISRASEETQKIVKTIDEIAFQTNLLALNAAVEAARAGEAGAGFAVVADEVRNLAMRAADAAKNTAALIEGTVKRVKEGSTLVEKTNREFGDVAVNVAKSGELVAEIAAASHEQAQGIDQVNKAVSAMDSVTQRNASGAEETASSAEEMSGQADQMKEFVAELRGVVGDGAGGKSAKKHSPSSPRAERPAVRTASIPKQRKTLAHSDKSGGRGTGTGLSASNRGAREARPEEIIPFDDEDFKDF